MIYYFTKKNDNNNGDFVDILAKKEDAHFLFVHHVEGAIMEKNVEPAEFAVM